MDEEKKVIRFQIVTPEKVVCDKEVYQATLPVMDGIVTILPNHRSYIAALKPGEVICKEDKNTKEVMSLMVAGGFVEFHKNKLIVLVDEAQRADEIDLEKAEEARKRAEELKSRVLTDESEYARVAASLEREIAKVNVARNYLRRRGL
jgi:F-type H+-transporting ATPase subunit epsilon